MQVKWRPEHEHTLVSADYNGFVHLWDLRHSIKAVSSFEAHAGKTLAIDWLQRGDESFLLSGGSDCTLKASAVI